MDESRAEELSRQLLWDHDAEPNKLTAIFDELRILGKTEVSLDEHIERYRGASEELLDFFERLRELAIFEASASGGSIDFSNSTISQILLECIRGYPDYVRAFDGTNILLNDELEKNRKLGQQVFEAVEHYEGIIREGEA